MRFAGLVVVAIAVVVLAHGSGTTVGADPTAESSATVILENAKPVPGHDVWELRLVLLTPTDRPTDGLDLRLRHVLGGERPAGESRFFTVSAEPDPETLVTNLGKLGSIEILDRANLPVVESQRANYVSGCRIPVPQVETRIQDGYSNSFVRTKFEEIGTKLRIESHKGVMRANINASFLLAVTAPYGYPIIAQANWETCLAVPVGRTAVFRTHYRVPGTLLDFHAGGLAAHGKRAPGAPEGVKAVRSDLGRILIVLLTHSRLP